MNRWTNIGRTGVKLQDIGKLLSHSVPEQATISCTIFDKNGNIQAVQRQFSKTEFLAQNRLFPRDLRKIDATNVDVAPTIAVREDCILVNMLYIKALIRSDSVMVFDISNPSYASRLSLLMYDMESKLKHGSSSSQPFEFRALECILVNVMAVLEGELKGHLRDCGSILGALDQQIDRARLRDLLVHSKSLTTFNQKALLIRNELDELLDNDEDLEGLYLSKGEPKVESSNAETQESARSTTIEGKEPPPPPKPKEVILETEKGDKKSQVKSPKNQKTAPLSSVHCHCPPEPEMDTADVEMLLESYYKQCDEIVQQAETLINDIKSTEEIVNIILDANRNSLMVYELKVSIYTLGFTVATLMPAFYGMNLKNYIEQSPTAFGCVVALSSLAGLSMVVYASRKLRLVQKMSTMRSEEMNSRVKDKVRDKMRLKLANRRTSAYDNKLLSRKAQQDVIWRWLVGK